MFPFFFLCLVLDYMKIHRLLEGVIKERGLNKCTGLKTGEKQ